MKAVKGTKASAALVGLIQFDERGLVPVVAQEADGTVLMLAWANREALAASIFHDGTHTVGEAKRFLLERGVEVRP